MSQVDKRLKGGKVALGARIFYHTIISIGRVIAFVYFRAYARRGSNMPRTGAVIVAPVHRSYLDAPLLGATSPRRLRYLGKDSLFKNRFWSWLLTTVGIFPIHREGTDRQAIEAAVKILERGEALAMFPEGERKSGPAVHPFLDGVAYMSAKGQVPILPVGIGGSGRAFPKGKYFPRPTKVVFLYGELIQPPPRQGKRVPRSEIKKLSATLHEAVQELFDEAQVMAGCPNEH